ncbi:MAG: hypothetical protein K6A63_01765 [Acholeplasmatales bacterium]|nr:hypothetical protein [Acholeplasmatales bacterium]
MKESKALYTYSISVMGMKCGMCESHINTSIRNKYNIKKVKSSRKKNLTEIISFEEILEADLISLITGLGYEASNFKKID